MTRSSTARSSLPSVTIATWSSVIPADVGDRNDADILDFGAAAGLHHRLEPGERMLDSRPD